MIANTGVALPVIGKGFNFGHWDTAMQVRVDVVRIGGRALFVVGIDKEYLLAGSVTGSVDNENGSGNAGTVKKGRWQTDNRFKIAAA